MSKLFVVLPLWRGRNTGCQKPGYTCKCFSSGEEGILAQLCGFHSKSKQSRELWSGSYPGKGRQWLEQVEGKTAGEVQVS